MTPRDYVRPGFISDPIHERIPFTGIERQVIDHQFTQRLRRVHQTGLSQYVYPELTGNRFSHSLGSMHLASRFLESCLVNSSPETVSELFHAILRNVSRTYNSGNWEEEDLPGLNHERARLLRDSNSNRALRAYELVDAIPEELKPAEPVPNTNIHETNTNKRGNSPITEQMKSAVYIVEQALRIATLFHDLGHLPFSHTFEDAIEDAGNFGSTGIEEFDEIIHDVNQWGVVGEAKKIKLHELVGMSLGRAALVDLHGELSETESSISRAIRETIFLTALAIVSAEPPTPRKADTETRNTSEDEDIAAEQSALQWLKSLISGDLDVDRADYILRDGRHYGFGFADFNLERLLGQLTVLRNENREFTLAVQPQAIGYVESFLIARYRSYQYGVRHHKCVQAAATLQQVIRASLTLAYAFREIKPDSIQDSVLTELRGFMKDLVTINKYFRSNIQKNPSSDGEPGKNKVRLDDAFVQRFSQYDDYWLTTLLRKIQFPPEQRLPSSFSETTKAVLIRDGKYYAAWSDFVWRRKSTMTSLWKRPQDFERQITRLREKSKDLTLPESLGKWNEKVDKKLSKGKTIGFTDYLPLGEIMNALLDEGIIISHFVTNVYTTNPKNAVSSNLIVAEGEKWLHLNQVSPSLASLQEGTKKDVHLLAFAPKSAAAAEDETFGQFEKVIQLVWDQLPEK